jgi:hypothetical protein
LEKDNSQGMRIVSWNAAEIRESESASSEDCFTRLLKSKIVGSTKRDVVVEFYGLPPIGQKQIRPMDGAQFHRHVAQPG